MTCIESQVKTEKAVETLIELRERLEKEWSISTLFRPDGQTVIALTAPEFLSSDIEDIEKWLEDVLEDFCIRISSLGKDVAVIIESSEF